MNLLPRVSEGRSTPLHEGCLLLFRRPPFGSSPLELDSSSPALHSRLCVCGVGFVKQPDMGVNLVLSNDVDDAEGRDREQAGDEATGGKRVKGTPDKDMTKT